jgi:3-dehydroquinate synthase
MDEIWVNLSSGRYPIRIEASSLGRLGTALKNFGAEGKVALVTNPRVDRLYGKTVRSGIQRAGLSSVRMVLPDGERFKTLASVRHLYDQLIAHRFERKSFMVALGGGVIGDVAGFAAATYLRGIPVVQVPTTLVSQVDASIGGKTGVDHPKGKNLIGAFHQPKMVYIDPLALSTLDSREFRAGLAEVVKYGVILDPDFFSFLEKEADQILARKPGPLNYMIRRCCELKAGVVQEDERESGPRRILNFGHTIGHAVETLGGYRKYLHGEAVSIGMGSAARMAAMMGLCTESDMERIIALLVRFDLPVSLPKVKAPDILKIVAIDKKVSGGKVHFILPERIGKVFVRGFETQEINGLVRWLLGLEKPSVKRKRRSASGLVAGA